MRRIYLLVLALVLFGIGRSRSTEQRNTKDIPAAGEPILALRENGDTVPELTQIGELHGISIARAKTM